MQSIGPKKYAGEVEVEDTAVEREAETFANLDPQELCSAIFFCPHGIFYFVEGFCCCIVQCLNSDATFCLAITRDRGIVRYVSFYCRK